MTTTIILPAASYATPGGPWHGIGGNIYYLPGYNDSWTGKLDDIGVWNRELTAIEVAQIWNGGIVAGGGGTVNISGAGSICAGAGILLIGTPSGGIWSSGSTSVATVSASGFVTGVSAGSAIITYSTVSGCVATSDTALVVVTSLPNAGTIVGATSLCSGAALTLTDAVGGGVWSSSMPGAVAVTSTGSIVGSSAGTSVISYSVSNTCGAATDTQLITVAPAPYAGVVTGPVSLCVGSSITLINLTSGGTWSASSGVASVGASSGVVGGVSAGTVVISYSVSNACGTATDTQLVTISPLPDAGTISASSAVICSGIAISLTNTAGGGTWTSSNVLTATINATTGVLSALLAGTTIITYTTAPSVYGCINSVTYPLTVVSSASFIANGTIVPIKCNGDNNGVISIIPSGGTGPYQYTWSNGSTASSIGSLGVGIYSVVVKDLSTNCIDTESFTLSMPWPIVIVPAVQNDECGIGKGSIDINVTGGTAPYIFMWSNGVSSEDLQGLHSGTFIVSVTDNNLCTSKLAVDVLLDSCNELVIHDVMTPNGDGLNDVWIIEGLNKYPNTTVELFDKWGDVVFAATNYSNNWAGEGKSGKLLPDGTYFYLVKLNAGNSYAGKNTFTGSFLIKR